jgi:hypothetical protein
MIKNKQGDLNRNNLGDTPLHILFTQLPNHPPDNRILKVVEKILKCGGDFTLNGFGDQNCKVNQSK